MVGWICRWNNTWTGNRIHCLTDNKQCLILQFKHPQNRNMFETIEDAYQTCAWQTDRSELQIGCSVSLLLPFDRTSLWLGKSARWFQGNKAYWAIERIEISGEVNHVRVDQHHTLSSTRTCKMSTWYIDLHRSNYPTILWLCWKILVFEYIFPRWTASTRKSQWSESIVQLPLNVPHSKPGAADVNPNPSLKGQDLKGTDWLWRQNYGVE